MSVRRAKAVDTPAIMGVIQNAYVRSRYVGRVGVDETYAKRLIGQCVMKDGIPRDGGTMVAVSEHLPGVIDGFIIGILDRVYVVGDRLSATDLMFVPGAGTTPRDAIALLDAFLEWAGSIDAVHEIVLGVTDVFGSYEATERLYERKGFERSGSMFRRTK